MKSLAENFQKRYSHLVPFWVTTSSFSFTRLKHRFSGSLAKLKWFQFATRCCWLAPYISITSHSSGNDRHVLEPLFNLSATPLQNFCVPLDNQSVGFHCYILAGETAWSILPFSFYQFMKYFQGSNKLISVFKQNFSKLPCWELVEGILKCNYQVHQNIHSIVLDIIQNRWKVVFYNFTKLKPYWEIVVYF